MDGKRVLTDAVAMLPLEWRNDERMPALARHSIQLWTLDLAGFDLQQHVTSLSRAEQSRAARIHDREKRQLYLGGRLGLKVLLSRYTGISADALEFAYGSRGKPLLRHAAEEGQIEFNYTLSRDKVLYAFALDRPLGVDMEMLPRIINAGVMAERKLCAEEQQAWRDLPPEFANDGMLCCWTRKEAYGKAIGVGIRYCLNQVRLFDQLDNAWWQTDLEGLFEGVNIAEMSRSLGGVQIKLPFNGVASVMYAQHEGECSLPVIEARTLKI